MRCDMIEIMLGLSDILEKKFKVRPRDMIIRDILIKEIEKHTGHNIEREHIKVSGPRVRLHVSPALRFKIRPYDHQLMEALQMHTGEQLHVREIV